MNITNIPAPRVPFIDLRTGLMAREWYRFFMNLFVLTGSGQSDISVTDLAIAPVVQDTLSTVPNLGPDTQLAAMMARWDALQLDPTAYGEPRGEAVFQLDPSAYCASSVELGGAQQFASLGSASAGQIIRFTGTVPAWTTATYPNTVAAGDVVYGSSSNVIGGLTIATAGKLLRSSGTLPEWSTPTFPNTATANKVLVGDGTNVVLSTPTIPLTSSPASGKLLIGDGTNWVASTPTYPNAAPGTGTFPRGDGTNFVTSTLILPNASTSGGVLYSSAANTIASSAALGSQQVVIGGGAGAAPTTSSSLTFDGTNFLAPVIKSVSGAITSGDGSGNPAIVIDGGATGNPFLSFRQNGTQKAYIQWNNAGAYLDIGGPVAVSSLAGAGTRAVFADANGVLSAP